VSPACERILDPDRERKPLSWSIPIGIVEGIERVQRVRCRLRVDVPEAAGAAVGKAEFDRLGAPADLDAAPALEHGAYIVSTARRVRTASGHDDDATFA